MKSFVSSMRMKKMIKRIKKKNEVATILGLDIGRIFVGASISDKSITKSKMVKTFELETGLRSEFYPTPEKLDVNEEFYEDLSKLIRDKKVQGLIVGYPILDNKPTKHANFIEMFVKYMYRNKILELPCTFVNEAYSTFEASHFLEMVQVEEGNYNPKFANNKKLKDQAAACVILQRFIDFYNIDEENSQSDEDDYRLEKKEKKIFNKGDKDKCKTKMKEEMSSEFLNRKLEKSENKISNEKSEEKKTKENDIFFKLTSRIASKKI